MKQPWFPKRVCPHTSREKCNHQLVVPNETGNFLDQKVLLKCSSRLCASSCESFTLTERFIPLQNTDACQFGSVSDWKQRTVKLAGINLRSCPGING
ncbi:hypothetical protein GN956_G12275 [Arapaima gigas]